MRPSFGPNLPQTVTHICQKAIFRHALVKFNKTNDIYADLIQKLKTSGYSKSYVERLGTEINWLIRNQNREDIQSYRDACRIRISRTKSRDALAAVFKSDLGVHTEAAGQILAYIPVIRQRRKTSHTLNQRKPMQSATHNVIFSLWQLFHRQKLLHLLQSILLVLLFHFHLGQALLSIIHIPF